MSSLSGVDLNLLVALDLLLDEGSVRGAARRAHVSPSAMSHTLGRLRDLLDDPVLVRAGRGMVPTPRAEALAIPIKELLAQARTVLSAPTRLDPARLARRFRIVCTDHVSTVLLPAVERILAAEAPSVDLSVMPLQPTSMEDLRRGQVDLAIGVFPEAPPETRARRLFEDRLITVSRAEHPRLAGTDRPDLEAYLREEHLLVAPRGTPVGLVDRHLEGLGRQRRVSRAFPGFLAALWHLRHTDGLLTISERLVRATVDRLDLHCMEPPLRLPPYALVMLWHPRVDGANEESWLREVLIRAADSLDEPPSSGRGSVATASATL